MGRMNVARDLAPALTRAAKQFPAVTLTGPRQSGKSTLCRIAFPDHPHVNLESPDVRLFAREDPRGFLRQYRDGAILDEVQRAPDLLSYLQGLIDADPEPGRWILTGSQNFSLSASISQSLAGRTAVKHLLPLSRAEVLRFSRPPETLEDTLLTGGYPRILDQGFNPSEWLRDYVATYVERDVRAVKRVGDLTTFQRFLELCAGRSAQLLNLSSLATDCGVSQPTAKAWLSILETSFILFPLRAFHANTRKRLVKMPKLHFFDTGLLCWLLGIREPEQLRVHPLRGPIFETWVVSEIAKRCQHCDAPYRLSFYRDRDGAEIDLIADRASRLALIEAKSAETASPVLWKGIRRVRRHFPTFSDLPGLTVYGGEDNWTTADDRLISWREWHRATW